MKEILMKLNRSLCVLTTAAALVGCGSSSSPAAQKPSGGNPAGTVLLAKDVAWTKVTEFVDMGAAWGDREQGAHGTFGRFPAGAKSPPHTHGQDYHGIVISGVMTNPFGTEDSPPELAAGSYWYVPAGEQHVTACISAEPCVFYFHSGAAFDFAPVDKLTEARSAEATATPQSGLAFEEIAPFVQMATAWGDRAKAAHGTFGIFKAQSESPSHTHTGAYHAVVISGRMANPYNGEKDAPILEPGSYWHVPAGTPHVTTCVSEEPCNFYFHAETSFDFQPLE